MVAEGPRIVFGTNAALMLTLEPARAVDLSQTETIDSRRVESAFDSQLRRWVVLFYIESLQVFPNCKSY